MASQNTYRTPTREGNVSDPGRPQRPSGGTNNNAEQSTDVGERQLRFEQALRDASGDASSDASGDASGDANSDASSDAQTDESNRKEEPFKQDIDLRF